MDDNDLHRHFLNNSQQDQQHPNIDDNKYNFHLEPDKIYCQICTQSRQPSQMYTMSQQCEPEHRFCFECLVRKVEEGIQRNQDIYCPVDWCPFLMTETGRFFAKLPNGVHNRYVMWKASSRYHERNRSFRESRGGEQGGYFGLGAVEERKKDREQVMDGFGAVSEQKKEKPARKEKKKKEPKPPKKANEAIKAPKPKPNPKPPKKQHQQLLQPRLAPQPAPPIPFHPPACPPPPAPLALPATTPRQKALKLLLLIFILPLMFLLMLILLLQMFLIYAIMLLSFLGAAGCIVLGVYCAIMVFTVEDEEQVQMYVGRAFGLLIGEFVCVGFVWFFMRNIRFINYLVIKNGWIWFIHKLIRIWAYPYNPPPIYLGPRALPQDNLH